MTDAELLEQVKMSKLWIAPGYMARPMSLGWLWYYWQQKEIVPVNRDYLMTILNRLEDFLETAP